jgi:2-amino-4-hydroxy-6-hydroxymethyldihydropteridine diphosphokinase
VTLAYVGIGSNLENPREQVKQAFDELGKIPRTRLTRKSSLFRSAPMGHTHQPEFVNAVVELDTGLIPGELLKELHQIEARRGRQRSFRNAPRVLDLDLLLYGKETLQSKELTLPHPRMHQRRFVLDPLVEIAPDIAVPGHGAAQDLLRNCESQSVERTGG